MPEPIVYVVSRWGQPSETFIRREASAVLEHRPIVVLSLKAPTGCSPDVPVVHLGPVTVLRGATEHLLRHPMRTGRLIGAVLRRSRWGTLIPRLAALAIGLAASREPQVREGTHLHAHFGWVSATTAWAASEATGTPYTVQIHAFEIHDDRYIDAFTPFALREARHTFVESATDQRYVAQRWGLDVAVNHLGLSEPWFAETDEAGREDLVVSVGRLVPKKGFDVLLGALAQTRGAPSCVIVGDGPERARLEALVDQLHLGDRVRLVGALGEAEIRALLGRASIAVLASVRTPDGDQDGTPMALIESMARGCAVIGTDVGGIPELLDGAGVVVPAGDVAALAEALDSLADPEVRRALADRAQQRASAGWRATTTAEVLLAQVG